MGIGYVAAAWMIKAPDDAGTDRVGDDNIDDGKIVDERRIAGLVQG